MSDTERLLPCPFCGDAEDLQILNQGDVVGWDCHYNCDIEKKKSFAQLRHTWFVNCPACGACGPEFYTGGEFGLKTDDECKQAATEAWNKRGGVCIPVKRRGEQ